MEIQLNKGLVTTVDARDYKRCIQGGLTWYAWASRRPDGSIRTHYAARNVVNPDGSRTVQFMHRFILGLTDRKMQADHGDGDGLNNTRHNLRKATNLQNSQNRVRLASTSTSGVTGVYWDKKNSKWVAEIVTYGKYKFLGRFTELKEAKEAREAALQERGL